MERYLRVGDVFTVDDINERCGHSYGYANGKPTINTKRLNVLPLYFPKEVEMRYEGNIVKINTALQEDLTDHPFVVIETMGRAFDEGLKIRVVSFKDGEPDCNEGYRICFMQSGNFYNLVKCSEVRLLSEVDFSLSKLREIQGKY